MADVDLDDKDPILQLARYQCPTNLLSGTNLPWSPYELVELVHVCDYEELTEPSKSRLDGMMALLLMMTGSLKVQDPRIGYVKEHFDEVS